jgi:threonine dehydrogenase-like Zn-dependent dehydrogenase
MQAAVLERPGHMILADHAEPDRPGPGEVLVAVRRVGICGTDHHAYRGEQNFFAYPRVLGHELAVEVLAVGPNVTGLEPGDLGAVLPYLSCGECRACRRGRTNCCQRINVLGVTRDGGLRERMVIPAEQLFTDPALTLDQLVLIETLGVGWHAVARAHASADDDVLVLGAGPIGLAVALAARPIVRHLRVADVSAQRVAFAESAGLEAVLAGTTLDADVLERGIGEPPSLVFDATGNRTSMEAAFGLTGPCGTLVFVGHTTTSITFANPPFHARELDVRASRNATVDDWSKVIDACRDRVLDAVGWINHRTTLPGIVDELPQLAADPGRVVKTVVEMGTAPAP